MRPGEAAGLIAIAMSVVLVMLAIVGAVTIIGWVLE